MKNWAEQLEENLPYTAVHCVANVYAVLPVSTVKFLCSGGREATPTSILIFDFYGINKDLVIWIWQWYLH